VALLFTSDSLHGQETRLMCNGFSKLLKVLLPNDLDCYEDLIIYAIAFMAVNLRDAAQLAQ
jgi:hypothetical protein